MELIEESTLTVADLIIAILSSGYGASFSKINREFDRRHFGRDQLNSKYNLSKENISSVKKDRFYSLIWKLKEEGLITQDKGNKILHLTRRGANKITLLKNRAEKKLPSAFYSKGRDDKLKIIIFDISEQER